MAGCPVSRGPRQPAGERDVRAWLEQLVARHGTELRGYLARFSQGSADIEDWVQEAFLRVCAAGMDRDLECPRAYLFTVARNVALGRLAHRKVRHAARFDIEMVDRARAEDPPVHIVAQSDFDTRRLRAAIERLPPRCRETFVLCKLHGFSQQEASNILGISTSTIEKHLSQGLKRCRAMLLGESIPADTAEPDVAIRARRLAR